MEGGKEGNIPPTDDTDGHGNFSLQKLNKIVENYSKLLMDIF